MPLRGCSRSSPSSANCCLRPTDVSAPAAAVCVTRSNPQTSYSTSIFLRNVTSSKRLKQLAELYGPAEWGALGAEAIAAAGDLVEVDLMYFQVRKGRFCVQRHPRACCWRPGSHLVLAARWEQIGAAAAFDQQGHTAHRQLGSWLCVEQVLQQRVRLWSFFVNSSGRGITTH